MVHRITQAKTKQEITRWEENKDSRIKNEKQY